MLGAFKPHRVSLSDLNLAYQSACRDLIEIGCTIDPPHLTTAPRRCCWSRIATTPIRLPIIRKNSHGATTSAHWNFCRVAAIAHTSPYVIWPVLTHASKAQRGFQITNYELKFNRTFSPLDLLGTWGGNSGRGLRCFLTIFTNKATFFSVLAGG